MEICKEFALGQGYSIAGVSYDDNVSGMKFNRRGLDMLTDAVETGQVDAMIAKDLSCRDGIKFRPHYSSTTCGRRMWQSFP